VQRRMTVVNMQHAARTINRLTARASPDTAEMASCATVSLLNLHINDLIFRIRIQCSVLCYTYVIVKHPTPKAGAG